ADMYPGQQSDRVAGVDLLEKIRSVRLSKIGFAEWQDARWCIDVADVGKTLGSEQFLRHVLGSQTDPRDLRQAHGRRFEGSLGGERWGPAKDTRGAGHRQRGQKPPSCVHHRKPPQAFNSRLSSFKKRQSVPSAMILCGVDLIWPTSCS